MGAYMHTHTHIYIYVCVFIQRVILASEAFIRFGVLHQQHENAALGADIDICEET